ncbi:hypothetical protein [Achromobacter dolens]|uniref:hypothetical protein n=1 Tax=Achromobacter dolens TaxID=1287738 RepID=UPI000A8EABE1|nr:hypothetical protein [Achromobacter dolens]
MDTKTLKFGSTVWYAGTAAIVQRVMKNGVVVSYEGAGPLRGQVLTRRVSARHLEFRGEHVNAA